jgi:phage-related protein
MSTGPNPAPKPLFWIGSSRTDVKAFPEDVRQTVGFALWEAQLGRKHRNAKVLRGFGGAGVLEVVEDYEGDTFRAVYTVKLKGSVYVLHAFQKKSKKGIATPTADRELIRRRLKAAEEQHEERRKTEEASRGTDPHRGIEWKRVRRPGP